ncbi:MAG: response regulator transcription factor [bacterium]
MRVLIVEDEHGIAQSIRKGLLQEKYIVDVAYDGMTGYDLASDNGYDVIILDLMLPKMDGASVCKKLRNDSIHTPILILTAKGSLHDKVEGLDIGADDYLTKPFAFEELLARIRALSRRPQQVEKNILIVDDLLLSTTTYEVKRGNSIVHLSSREYSLLEYLMRNHDQVISKNQIIEHVWNYDSDILPNTIEVYIKNLRKKIDMPFPTLSPLIQTVRGFGYKIS